MIAAMLATMLMLLAPANAMADKAIAKLSNDTLLYTYGKFSGVNDSICLSASSPSPMMLSITYRASE